MKTAAEINETENDRTIEKINKTKKFLKDKINKSFARLKKKKDSDN